MVAKFESLFKEDIR